MADDALTDFARSTFTHDGVERTLFRRGIGPAVIVMAEMPGITPKVADFARRVAAVGCTAVVPHLFGRPGRDPVAGSTLSTVGYLVRSMVPACISREFTVFATGRTSPVVDWLRALAAHEHGRCGGPGVGAVGMCFTGGFALAMSTEPSMLAPVLAQPSLPMGRAGKGRIDCSSEDLAVVAGRCDAEGLEVMGLRFRGDSHVPQERFDHLREELGDAFIAVELDPESAAPDAFMKPHSTLTEHLVDEPGQPTRAALDQVLEFLRGRLIEA